MYHHIIFLTLVKTINPYLSKYALNTLESHETLYIDSILIFFIVFCLLIYKYFFGKKEIFKTIDNFKKLTISQIITLVIGSSLSVITSISIYELDKKHNNLFINHTITKITSMILFLLISIFIFKENCDIKKMFGAGFSIFGLYLLLS